LLSQSGGNSDPGSGRARIASSQNQDEKCCFHIGSMIASSGNANGVRLD